MEQHFRTHPSRKKINVENLLMIQKNETMKALKGHLKNFMFMLRSGGD
jgi:hypothetical protein